MLAPILAVNRYTWSTLVIGMMPGTIGTATPAARARATNSKYTRLSKNSCVIRKLAPASTFSTAAATSWSRDGDSTCFSGEHAATTQSSALAWRSRTSSLPKRSPPGGGTNTPSPLGGSPRIASTFSTPNAWYWRISSTSSSTVESLQVRWAMGSSPVSSRIRLTRRTVRSSRALPPAPCVTDTKAGSRSRSAAMVAKSRSAPSSSRGGKNSNENSGSPRAKRLSMRMLGW